MRNFTIMQIKSPTEPNLSLLDETAPFTQGDEHKKNKNHSLTHHGPLTVYTSIMNNFQSDMDRYLMENEPR